MFRISYNGFIRNGTPQQMNVGKIWKRNAFKDSLQELFYTVHKDAMTIIIQIDGHRPVCESTVWERTTWNHLRQWWQTWKARRECSGTISSTGRVQRMIYRARGFSIGDVTWRRGIIRKSRNRARTVIIVCLTTKVANWNNLCSYSWCCSSSKPNQNQQQEGSSNSICCCRILQSICNPSFDFFTTSTTKIFQILRLYDSFLDRDLQQ